MSISKFAAWFALTVAFMAGIIGSLAIRPPSMMLKAPPTLKASLPLKAPATTETDPGQPVATSARVHWRVPVAFNTNLPSLGDNILYIAETLKTASAGNIVLEVHEPGTIVPAFSITEAVKRRKVLAGYTWLGYDQGIIPVSPLFSAVPFGMNPWEFMAWWYEGGGEALALNIYRKRGLQPILCGLIGPETAGWFREPINSLDDLRGLKIRFAGLGGQVLQRLGASVTVLPGGEIFQALEKGALDATEYSAPIIDQFLGFHRIAKNNYFPGWHQTFTAFHIIVNLAAWEQLMEADKALITASCTAGVARNLAKGEAMQGAILQNFPKVGVTARQLPEPLLRELAATTELVLAEKAAEDAEFATVYEHQKAFRKQYSHWKKNAYLPKDF